RAKYAEGARRGCGVQAAAHSPVRMRQDAFVAARPSRSGVPALPVQLDRRFEAAVVVGGPGRGDLRAVADELAGFAFAVAFVSAGGAALRAALGEPGRGALVADEVRIADEASAAAELLADRPRRGREGEFPACESSPAWTVVVEGFDPTLERAHE